MKEQIQDNEMEKKNHDKEVVNETKRKDEQDFRKIITKMKEKTTIVSLASMEGGVGKTIIAAALAWYLKEEVKEEEIVILIDFDFRTRGLTLLLEDFCNTVKEGEAKNNTVKVLDILQEKRVKDLCDGIDKAKGMYFIPVYDVNFDHKEFEELDSLIADLGMEGLASRFAETLQKITETKKRVTIIIDTQSGFSNFTLSALLCSHYVYVFTEAETYRQEGFAYLMKLLSDKGEGQIKIYYSASKRRFFQAVDLPGRGILRGSGIRNAEQGITVNYFQNVHARISKYGRTLFRKDQKLKILEPGYKATVKAIVGTLQMKKSSQTDKLWVFFSQEKFRRIASLGVFCILLLLTWRGTLLQTSDTAKKERSELAREFHEAAQKAINRSDFPTALDFINNAMVYNSENQDIGITYAELLFNKLGRKNEAIAKLEEYPNNMKALDILGRFYEEEKKYPNAIEKYMKLSLMTPSPEKMNYMYKIANIEFKQGNSNDALNVYRDILKGENFDSIGKEDKGFFYYKFGELQFLLHKWEDANSSLKKAFEHGKKIPSEAYYYLAISSYNMEQSDTTLIHKHATKYINNSSDYKRKSLLEAITKCLGLKILFAENTHVTKDILPTVGNMFKKVGFIVEISPGEGVGKTQVYIDGRKPESKLAGFLAIEILGGGRWGNISDYIKLRHIYKNYDVVVLLGRDARKQHLEQLDKKMKELGPAWFMSQTYPKKPSLFF